MPVPTRPTRAIIDLPALRSNLRFIQETVGPSVRVMPVVKANAYGHGIAAVSHSLESAGCSYLGVAFPEEGEILRLQGIRADVHVFTLPVPEQADLCAEHELEPTIGDEASLEFVNRASAKRGRQLSVHVKVETGMNRIGVRPEDLARFLKKVGRMRRVHVKGVFTHFATSDRRGSGFVRTQLSRFHRALEVLRRERVEVEFVHAANSGGVLRYPESHFDMVRTGILLYGYPPAREDEGVFPVRPVMRLLSSVSQVKRIKAGDSVSYGRSFVADAVTTIATIPIGYGDGLFRALSGKTSVLINGKPRRIAGRVCMDQCMVDCGRSGVSVGDEVVLIGSQKNASLTAWDHAVPARTIPYEIVCAVSSRVPREYRQ